MLTPAQADALLREGLDALRSGDGAAARTRLDAVVASGAVRPPWLALAQACRLVGDREAEEAALERVLAEDVRNLPALLLLGERKAADGDDRGASLLFQAALNAAAASGAPPSPGVAPLLARAEAFMQAARGRFEAHLLAAAEEAGGGSRIARSLDLLLGRTQLYLQQPSMFYFPGLPQRQFYDPADFPWLRAIEAAVPAMQAELAAVLDGGEAIAPYVEAVPGQPRPNNPLLGDPSWGAFYFWKRGAIVEENARRCPATMAALAAAPIPVIRDRSPMALWSVLRPGTHIQPHHGLLNTRLICHVPLLVPPGCGLRVGSETRGWREGEPMIFDDSFEHEAWNRGDRTRVVLLFEVWRPEIDEEERAALTRIFEAIDDYRGIPAKVQ